MVHVLIYGMPNTGKKKRVACEREVREAVANHAATGGPQNVWAFFLPVQNEQGSIVAHVYELEMGCHATPSKDQKDELCRAVAGVLATHRPPSKRTVRGVEVYTHPRNFEAEGNAIYSR